MSIHANFEVEKHWFKQLLRRSRGKSYLVLLVLGSQNGENEAVENRQHVLRTKRTLEFQRTATVSFSSLRETLGEIRQLQFNFCSSTSPPLSDYEVLSGCHN